MMSETESDSDCSCNLKIVHTPVWVLIVKDDEDEEEYLKLDPPEVELEDVEDFLATDDLFVEYFNVFLALPTFPVPLCFNKDTGGFEVVSDAKKDLAQQIKTAMRSQKRTPRIYKVAKKHSFIDIPLFPIEIPTDTDNVEINTSFTVTTLNKEQGIHWIKAERLPTFLDSDLYLEYRISKLLSQAKITGEHGEYVLMKIDFKPKKKKVKKKEAEEEVKVDPKELLMKNLYVCMGNAGTTDTDAWYSTAKVAQETESTYSALSRPQSETVHSKTGSRPISARPASAYTDPYHRSDSGMGSSLKSSARGNSCGSLSQSKYSAQENEDEILGSKLFSSDGRPGSHKIADSACLINKEHSNRSRPFSATVYSTPKVVNFDNDPDGDTIVENDDERDSGKGDEGDEHEVRFNLDDSLGYPDAYNKELVFRNVDDVGALIVGIVLKTAMSKLTGKSFSEIEKIDEIQKMFPDESFAELTIESLDKICFKVDAEKVSDETDEKVEMVGERMKKALEEESDVDSLLDSEDDFEESDTFFRKHKFKMYDLRNRKGIEQFKRFLKGTQGEKNWNLWIDIDRMNLMTNEEEIQLYLSGLREKYHKPGAEFELTTEQKNHLGLVEPSSWTLDKMFDIQNDIAEPLVLYWAPRFLLKQLMRLEPDRNLLYQHQKLLKPHNGIDPNPPTVNLLPLRPKSCHPRLRNGAIDLTKPEIEIQPSPQHLFTEEMPELDTSPPVGMKRSYAPPTLEFIDRWQKEQRIHAPHIQLVSPRSVISPRVAHGRTSTPRIKSAPPRRSSPTQALSRPKSSRSLRPLSAKSNASQVSVESATGRYRVKSASERGKASQISLKLPTDNLTPRHNGDRLSRPGSAASSIASVNSLRSETDESETSEFYGGRRMEALLQVLHHEPDSGGFFKRYVERSDNKRWIDNLSFWHDVQSYHLLFYSKSLDAYVVNKKAKVIHSQYLAVGSPHFIRCSAEICRDVYNHLDPPFEELYDEAEEHAITVLFEAWIQMLDTDQKTYNKVELIDVSRHLETKSKYVLHLQKRGLIKERASTPDMMEGYHDPVYDAALIKNIPEQFKDYTLEKLIHNRIELEHFRNFLADNYASMDIMCWMDIEAFRRIGHTEERKRDLKAKDIKIKYLNKKYFFGPNSPAGKEGQEKVAMAGGGWGKLLEDRPPTPIILEAQKYVQERLEKKWLPLFLATEDFAERQKPHTSMDEVVDDVLVQKKKKSQAVWKLLESKWVSSSKEIITFRKALLNPVTSIQFRRYVSIKGDTLENNVLFWLEVQKFKNMYHCHNDDSLITQKINTTINCFIDSQIPPTLQIDIPQEVADKILEHKYEKSPYLFREAQLIVFRVLFSHWNEFCEFRSNLAEEKIMPLIERRRKHAKIKERQRQIELEEKQARIAKRARSRLLKQREAERRAALGLPPLGEEEDVFHDPFKTPGAESVEGEQEAEEKDKISWSYSNYMAALEKEELLNNTDETSFSSLLTANTATEKDNGSDKESVASKHSESGEKKTGKLEVESQTTDRRKSVKISNGKKAEEAEVPKKKVKDTGSRKSSVDAVERRGSQSKQSSVISTKPPISPDTLTVSSKTHAKTSKEKSKIQQKK